MAPITQDLWTRARFARLRKSPNLRPDHSASRTVDLPIARQDIVHDLAFWGLTNPLLPPCFPEICATRGIFAFEGGAGTIKVNGHGIIFILGFFYYRRTLSNLPSLSPTYDGVIGVTVTQAPGGGMRTSRPGCWFSCPCSKGAVDIWMGSTREGGEIGCL